MSEIYLDLVKAIRKAEKPKLDLAILRHLNFTIGKYEPRAQTLFIKLMESALKKFAKKINAKMFQEVFKDKKTDLKARLQKLISDSFGVAAANEYIDLYSPMISELVEGFNLGISYDMVNSKATNWLTDNAESLFKTLSESQADRVFQAVSTEMQAPEGYDIYSVADKIKDELNNGELPNIKNWAEMTARTETARAATASSQITANQLGLKTLEFHCQETACDDCSDLDNEILEINSEDLPPIHVNCRCIAIFSSSEISGLSEED